MGNRPHPHGRRDTELFRMSDAEFQRECDKAFLDETARDAAEKAERIRAAETSQEQREWEGHDASCEAEFIAEAGLWSPCRCLEGER